MDSDPFASESVLFNIRSFSVTVVCCTKFGLFCLKTVPSSRKNTLLFPPPFVLGDFWPFPPPSPSSSLSLLSFFHLSIAHFCPRRLKVPLMLPPPSSLPSHPFSPAFTSPDCFLSCCLHLRFPAHFPLRSPHGPWLSLPPSCTGAVFLPLFLCLLSQRAQVCARACLVVFFLSLTDTSPRRRAACANVGKALTFC